MTNVKNMMSNGNAARVNSNSGATRGAVPSSNGGGDSLWRLVPVREGFQQLGGESGDPILLPSGATGETTVGRTKLTKIRHPKVSREHAVIQKSSAASGAVTFTLEAKRVLWFWDKDQYEPSKLGQSELKTLRTGDIFFLLRESNKYHYGYTVAPPPGAGQPARAQPAPEPEPRARAAPEPPTPSPEDHPASRRAASPAAGTVPAAMPTPAPGGSDKKASSNGIKPQPEPAPGTEGVGPSSAGAGPGQVKRKSGEMQDQQTGDEEMADADTAGVGSRGVGESANKKQRQTTDPTVAGVPSQGPSTSKRREEEGVEMVDLLDDDEEENIKPAVRGARKEPPEGPPVKAPAAQQQGAAPSPTPAPVQPGGGAESPQGDGVERMVIVDDDEEEEQLAARSKAGGMASGSSAGPEARSYEHPLGRPPQGPDNAPGTSSQGLDRTPSSGIDNADGIWQELERAWERNDPAIPGIPLKEIVKLRLLFRSREEERRKQVGKDIAEKRANLQQLAERHNQLNNVWRASTKEFESEKSRLAAIGMQWHEAYAKYQEDIARVTQEEAKTQQEARQRGQGRRAPPDKQMQLKQMRMKAEQSATVSNKLHKTFESGQESLRQREAAVANHGQTVAEADKAQKKLAAQVEELVASDLSAQAAYERSAEGSNAWALVMLKGVENLGVGELKRVIGIFGVPEAKGCFEKGELVACLSKYKEAHFSTWISNLRKSNNDYEKNQRQQQRMEERKKQEELKQQQESEERHAKEQVSSMVQGWGCLNLPSFLKHCGVPVPPNASQTQLHSGYKKVMLKYHPDRMQGKGTRDRVLAEEITKQLNILWQQYGKNRPS